MLLSNTAVLDSGYRQWAETSRTESGRRTSRKYSSTSKTRRAVLITASAIATPRNETEKSTYVYQKFVNLARRDYASVNPRRTPMPDTSHPLLYEQDGGVVTL